MKTKVALITGAASGIGLAVAKVMSAEGYRVCIADLDGVAARHEADLLVGRGSEAFGVSCDVTDEQQIEATIDQVVQRFGRIDVLVNSAGRQYISPIESFPSDHFEAMIKLMLTAPFYAIKHVFPMMKEQKFGRILNVASINGLVGFAGKAAYNSAKHGVIGLTKVAALEGATHGITVNAICPGYVDTPLVRNQLADLARSRGISKERVLEEVIYSITPQRRLLEAKEVADYIVYLSSDAAKGVTGQSVVIDGGYTAQ